jgi:hypothetical protein
MAGVLRSRPLPVVAVFALYAAMAVACAWGVGPGSGWSSVAVLTACPFVLGLAIARGWVAAVVFVLVAATALLPDRAVVHTTANSSTTVINSTPLEPMLVLAVLAATAAFAGVRAARSRLAP